MSSSSLYTVLGAQLSRLSSADDIKRAYHRAALRTHPDKGGSAEQYQSVAEAYEILKDSQTRKYYDAYGLEATRAFMKRGREPRGGFPSAMFGGMQSFSFMFSGTNSSMLQRFQVSISLEQIYLAKPIEVVIPQPSENVDTEESKIVATFDSLDAFSKTNFANVHARNKHGLLQIRFVLEPHSFVIGGPRHLIHVAQISLGEALTGTTVRFALPDGKLVCFDTDPTQIITPSTVLPVAGKHAPFLKSGWSLSVRFNISFPSIGWSDAEQRKQLRSILAQI